MRLDGKAAIVTGGASGIRRAICELFAEEGARVTIADIDVEGGERTLANIRAAGGEAQFVATDVSKEEDVEAMVRAATDAYGAVNILVNDAAAFVFGGSSPGGSRSGAGTRGDRGPCTGTHRTSSWAMAVALSASIPVASCAGCGGGRALGGLPTPGR